MEGFFANDDENLDPKNDPKNLCTYCGLFVKGAATSCDECEHYNHFRCLEQNHTWRGETIALPPKFFKWLKNCPVDDEEQGYSFVCSKCNPDIPPLLMQLWASKTLTVDVACDLDVWRGPLQQYAREHPRPTHDHDIESQVDPKENDEAAHSDIESHMDPKEDDDASHSDLNDISQTAQPDSLIKMMELIMRDRKDERKEEQERRDEDRKERERREREEQERRDEDRRERERDREERANLLATLFQRNQVPQPPDPATTLLAKLPPIKIPTFSR